MSGWASQQTGPISAQVMRGSGGPFPWASAQTECVQDWHSHCRCQQTVPIYHDASQCRCRCAPPCGRDRLDLFEDALVDEAARALGDPFRVDLAARHSGVHRGLCDCGSDDRRHAEVHACRNDVLGFQLVAWTMPAIACAAAIFIASLMSVARTSSAPRKMPGTPGSC